MICLCCFKFDRYAAVVLGYSFDPQAALRLRGVKAV